MELPSTYRFQGWTIKYNLLDSSRGSDLDKIREQRSIVFVHGTPWSSAVFRPIVQALLARGPYRILVYDLPGYGRSQELEDVGESYRTPSSQSERFVGDTSVKFQALALQALLDHVGLDGRRKGHSKPAVIAHDIAGAIVLRAHLILGCCFKSMMLCDTNAVLPWGDGFYKLARSEPQVFVDMPPKIFEAIVRAVIRSARYDSKTSPTAWEDELAMPWIVHPGKIAGVTSATRQQSFVRQIAQANDQDIAEMLEGDMYSRVRCDVKIVWGEQDDWIPREKVEELRKRIGERVKECAFIPEAGHLVMLDQPERFAIEVYDWMNGCFEG